MLRLFSRQKNRILSLSATRHLFSTTAAASSNLYSKYSFVPPPSLKPENPNSAQSPLKKQPKPRYRPPSSLDRTGEKPLQSKLPFDFRFSYTESSPDVRPIGLREPKYSPFGPGKLDRVWTGVCAPVVDPKVGSPDDEKTLEEKKRVARERIQGEPLTNAERKALVERCQRHKTKRQVNLGRDGLTHNMLNDIHNNWKHAEAVRIKCMGVPTVDMKNVCTQLEDLVPCILVTFDKEQIVAWRGKNYKPSEDGFFLTEREPFDHSNNDGEVGNESGEGIRCDSDYYCGNSD